MSQTKQTLGREEEAELMLAHTAVSPVLAWTSIVLFVITLLGVPALQYAPAFLGVTTPSVKTGVQTVRNSRQAAPEKRAEEAKVRRVALEGAPPVQRRSVLDFLAKAEEIKAFEKQLEERSLLFSKVRPQMQMALTSTLQASNAQVYPGQDGWLFYQPEIEYLTGSGFLDPAHLQRRAKGETQPNPIPAIVHFKQQLAERGIALIVVPAPVKASIYPEKLYAGFSGPTPQNASLDEFCRLLEAEGIPVFDPTSALLKAKHTTGEPQFVPTDTHWSPAAVEAAAQGLAQVINKHIQLPRSGRVNYVRHHGRSSLPGDLVRLLGLPENQTLYPAHEVKYQSVSIKRGKRRKSMKAADVLLLGDSFSGSYQPARAGLAQQLSFTLRRRVECLAVPNGGSFKAREKLQQELLKGRDRLAGKRLVIYEFTARDLSLGNWKILDLPPVKAAGPPPQLALRVRTPRTVRQG